MTLSLKEQFQIKTVNAYQAADGTKFHDLTEAQDFTRRKMLSSLLDYQCKQRPEFATIPAALFVDFCLTAGKTIGAIMAEGLEPKSDIYASAATKVFPVKVEPKVALDPRNSVGLRERMNAPFGEPAPLRSDTGRSNLSEAMASVDVAMIKEDETLIADIERALKESSPAELDRLESDRNG